MNLVNFDTMDYEPDEIADETTLTETSLSIIMDSIKQQFKDPSGDTKTDFVSTFIARYHLSLKEISDDFSETESAELHEIHKIFISFMEEIFKKKLKLGIVELEDMSEDEQETVVHQLYRFFIINISQNLYNFILHYIEKNKSALASILPSGNTVSKRRMADLMDDKEMIQICANLQDVVKVALTDENITVTEFFELCVSKEKDLEYEFVVEQYDTFAVTGNFVNKYRKMLPEWMIVEMESKILSALVRKYRAEEN